MFNCVSIRLAVVALCTGWLVVSVGCSTEPARAKVKGKVALGDKPLTVGNVVFTGKDKLSGSGSIDKDGNYVVNDAPVGDVTVSVVVPRPPMGGMEMMKRMKNSPAMKSTQSVDPNDPSRKMSMPDVPDNIVPIPQKYNDPSTSGLTYTVKYGEQTHDITLSP